MGLSFWYSADFPRRNSVACRESVGPLRDLDDKENGKDQILKPAKARSPTASSKGTKNFMSPTISASCKIIESPRKKVLIERNEPVPTSVPSADAKSHVRKVTFADPLECGDFKPPDLGLEEERKLDALFDGVPNFEESHGSCLTSEEDLSGETVHDANVPLIPKSDTDLSFEAGHDVNDPLVLENDIDTEEPSFETVSQADCVNLDPTFKLSPTPPPASSTATILAPLDADPLMPPYDPKTNYLSPRPQFLHYKPKPRMELCNESIISGSFSDTEVTQDTQSEGSQKETEEVSSDEIAKEEESQTSESISPGRTFMLKETVEAKEVPKPRFSMRSKSIGLILLLSVAFLSISVTNSPVVGHTVFENMYEAYEASEFSEFARANFDRLSQFAKANFDGLAQNLHIWFIKSLSSLSELISNLRGLHVHSLAQLQYCNLTVLHDYAVVNQYPVFGRGKNEILDIPDMHPPIPDVRESDAASEIDTDEDIEDISEEHYEEQVQQELGIITGVENALDAPQSVEVLNDQSVTIIIEADQSLQVAEAGNLEAKQSKEPEEVLKGQPEPEQALQLAEARISEAKLEQEYDANFSIENQPDLNSEASEFHIDVHGAGYVDAKQAQENDAKFSVDEQSNVGLKHWPGLDSEDADIHNQVYDDKAEGNSATTDAAIRGNEQRSETTGIPPRMVLYLLLCGGVVLIAVAAFNWSRKGKSRGKRVASSVEQPLFGKELHASSLQALNKQISPEKPSLRNDGPMEMEVLEEPCPSEMSSFQKSSSSYSKNVAKQLNEAHSLEKKRKNNHRRESLASSSDYSMGSSPSYGSLTVYEKIPSKQVNILFPYFIVTEQNN